MLYCYACIHHIAVYKEENPKPTDVPIYFLCNCNWHLRIVLSQHTVSQQKRKSIVSSKSSIVRNRNNLNWSYWQQCFCLFIYTSLHLIWQFVIQIASWHAFNILHLFLYCFDGRPEIWKILKSRTIVAPTSLDLRSCTIVTNFAQTLLKINIYKKSDVLTGKRVSLKHGKR